MKKILINNKKNLFYILFIYLISAINNPLTIPNSIDMNSIISFVRGVAPLILLPFLILYLLINFRKLNIDIIYILFFLYLIFQTPYFFYYDFITFYELNWVLSGLSILFLFLIFSNEDLKFKKNILNIFLVVILLVSIKFTYDLYSDYIKNYLEIPKERKSFYGWNTMAPSQLFMNQPVPRSSGLSRMLMVLWVFLFAYYIKQEFKRNLKIILLTLLVLINFTVFHLESRLMTLFQISFLIYLVFFKILNLDLKKKSFIIVITFIIPYTAHIFEGQVRDHFKEINDLKIFFSEVQIAKLEKHYKMKKSNIIIKVIKNDIIIQNIILDDKKSDILKEDIKNKEIEVIEVIDQNVNKQKKQIQNIKQNLEDKRIAHTHLSGRDVLWKKTFQLVKNNNFLGFGPQSDRILLNQNVSGIFFYSLITGGIFSFLSLVSVYIIIIIRLFKIIFIEKIFNNTEVYFTISILLLGMLYIRSVGEITFGIFGIDMFLFFISLNLFNNFKSIKKN